jgi:hypothetical protein
MAKTVAMAKIMVMAKIMAVETVLRTVSATERPSSGASGFRQIRSSTHPQNHASGHFRTQTIPNHRPRFPQCTSTNQFHHQQLFHPTHALPRAWAGARRADPETVRSTVSTAMFIGGPQMSSYGRAIRQPSNVIRRPCSSTALKCHPTAMFIGGPQMSSYGRAHR